MLRTEHFYWVLAGFLLYAGWRNLRERRYAHTAFWTLLALLFAGGEGILEASKAGSKLPAQLAGAAVIALALLATRMRREHIAEAPEAQRRASALRLGHRLFVPALLIPLVTVLVVLFGAQAANRLDAAVRRGQHHAFRPCAGAASWPRSPRSPSRASAPSRPLVEGRRLLDTMGWAALLPLVLATLGGVFAASGVGDAVAALVSAVIPADSRARVRARVRTGHGRCSPSSWATRSPHSR